MRPHSAIICTALAVIATLTASAHAAPDKTGVASYPAYADVISARKVTERESRQTPVKRCTWERLPSEVRYERYGERHVIERRAKRCRTVYETNSVDRIVGYDVTLRYNGETFTRRMRTHPGVRLPVTVEIQPVEKP